MASGGSNNNNNVQNGKDDTTSSSSWPRMILPETTTAKFSKQTKLLSPSSSDEILRKDLISVLATMNYVSSNTCLIQSHRDLSGSDSELLGAEWKPTNVSIRNARRRMQQNTKTKEYDDDDEECDEEEENSGPLTLHRNGFELVSESPKISEHLLLDIDFLDQIDVVRRYYPLCESLVTKILHQHEKKFYKDKDKGEDDDDDDEQKTTTTTTTKPRFIVKAFDHNVRSKNNNNNNEIKKIRNGSGKETIQGPAGLVHGDYTSTSAPKRVKLLTMPPKKNDVVVVNLLNETSNNESSTALSLLNDDPSLIQDIETNQRRFALINVWRNIRRDHAVRQYPLACVDSRTVDIDDLRIYEIHYEDRIGENYFACHPDNNRKHNWWYYPAMTMDEALLIKQWDSEGTIAKSQKKTTTSDNNCDDDDDDDEDHDLSTFALHSAFMDSTCPDDISPDRESIEVRCVVIWDKKEEE